MMDAIGNKITESSILCWHPDARNGLICTVVHISDGGIATGNGREVTPPMLVVQVMIPVTGVTGGREASLENFLCVVNPAAAAAMEKMLEGQRRQ